MNIDKDKFVGNALKVLSDLLLNNGGGTPEKEGEGEPSTPSDTIDDREFFREFDRDHEPEYGIAKSIPRSSWQKYLPKYRKESILDPIEQHKKPRFVYDEDHGQRLVYMTAPEYSKIPKAQIMDFVLNRYDQRILRKEFDIPMYESKDEGHSTLPKTPYTFALVDVSGSMSGIRADHACAIVQIAAEKVFNHGGKLVLLPYGSPTTQDLATSRLEAVVVDNIVDTITALKRLNFGEGTTCIGDNLKTLVRAIKYHSEYTTRGATYHIPDDVDYDMSKILVIHDGEDSVPENIMVDMPIFAVMLANDHEVLKKLARKTGGKYTHINQDK